MFKKTKITGAIFCGGESRRMGTDKAGLVLPGGMTMIESIVKAMTPFCREIVLVGQAKGVPDTLSHLKKIPDNYSRCGPIGGLEALLNSGLAPEYLTSPCDFYRPDPKIFEMLMNFEGFGPVVIRYKKQIQPLIGRFPDSLKSLATQHIAYDHLAMKSFIKNCQAQYLDIPDNLGKDMINVNTPDDLKIKR